MMSGHHDIVFLRHGRTAWNATGRIQGQLETDLDETGHAQAREMARLLPLHVGDAAQRLWVASPARRVRQTLEPLLRAADVREARVRFDARLLERHFGIWQGRSREEMLAGAEIDMNDAAAYFHWRPAGGGESLADVRERVAALLEEMPGPMVMVAHGGVFRALCNLLAGWPEERVARLRAPQGVVVHFRDGAVQLPGERQKTAGRAADVEGMVLPE